MSSTQQHSMDPRGWLLLCLCRLDCLQDVLRPACTR